MSIKLDGATGLSVTMCTVINKGGNAKGPFGVHSCCRCEKLIGGEVVDGERHRPRHVKLLLDLYLHRGTAAGKTKQLFFCIPCWQHLSEAGHRAVDAVIAESDTPDCAVWDWPGW